MARPLLIIAGPHGVGKDTLIDSLVSDKSRVERVARYITRPAQPNEQSGRTYRHVTRVQFVEEIAKGAFAEYAKHPDSWSGTTWADIQGVGSGRIGILASNPDDGAVLRRVLVSRGFLAVSCFVSPVSRESFLDSEHEYLQELELRMRARHRPSDHIERRLGNAREFRHLELSGPADFFVANERDRLRSAQTAIAAIVSQLLTGT